MLYRVIVMLTCRKCGRESDDNAYFCSYCGTPFYWAPYKRPPIPLIGITTIGVGLFQFAFGYSNPGGTLAWALIDYATGISCCLVGTAYILYWNKSRKAKFRPLEDNETVEIESSEEGKEQAFKYD